MLVLKQTSFLLLYRKGNVVCTVKLKLVCQKEVFNLIGWVENMNYYKKNLYIRVQFFDLCDKRYELSDVGLGVKRKMVWEMEARLCLVWEWLFFGTWRHWDFVFFDLMLRIFHFCHKNFSCVRSFVCRKWYLFYYCNRICVVVAVNCDMPFF